MSHFLNVVGSSAVKLQEELKRLNADFGFDYALTGDESYKELQQLVKEAQEKARAIEAKNGSDNHTSTPNGAQKESGKSDAVYVWLKNPAYVDKDGMQRLGVGFYHISFKDFPRLAKLTDRKVCEVFAEVPTRKLAEIAKWFGINVEKYNDNELLAMLVKEPALY